MLMMDVSLLLLASDSCWTALVCYFILDSEAVAGSCNTGTA